MLVLSSIWNQPWFILVLIIVFFGIIALLVFILRDKLKISKTEKPKDEKKIAEENLSHYLEDVDDPETQKMFDEYAKKADENEKKDDKTESK